ncbi:hypothetical protein ACIRU8_39050 [Streptomyces sp. NPDC101175]
MQIIQDVLFPLSAVQLDGYAQPEPRDDTEADATFDGNDTEAEAA